MNRGEIVIVIVDVLDGEIKKKKKKKSASFRDEILRCFLPRQEALLRETIATIVACLARSHAQNPSQVHEVTLQFIIVRFSLALHPPIRLTMQHGTCVSPRAI